MRSTFVILWLAIFVFTPVKSWAQTIANQIDAIVARSAVAGNTWTMLVENADGSVIYYQRNPTTGQAPASNTKMFTTSAAFGLLGTNYAFVTRIYQNGTITAGTLSGDLNLVCEHDPTWNTSVFSSARKPLDTIAAALKAQGLTSVTGNVQCYGLCAYDFGETDNLSGTTTQAKNADAATAFTAALQAQGITVFGSAVGQTGFTAPGTLFYTYYSTNLTYGGKPLRLDVACIPLLKVSHNVMADGLLRHLGWKLTGTDSYTAGRNQVLPWLKNVAGLNTNGIAMNDGSGLSWNNRFSARQCVSLIRYMLTAFPSWDDGLPIACTDGTIGSRICGTNTTGQVHAKTGTLSISVALSGYINNKHDGQRYLFSFVANHVDPIDTTASRDAVDDAVAVLGARGVPFSPELIEVFSRANGTSLKLTWSNEDFVRTGYRVYPSADGVNFGPSIDVATNVHSYTDSSLTPGTKKYYKVSVVSTGGESRPSRIYGAQVGGASPMLIVDGDDRWQFQAIENPKCTNHNFCATAGQSVSGPNFDTANHNAVIDGTVSLTNYQAVVWLSGEESTADESFSAIEQPLVTDYLNAGGNLFVSGSEIGWDLDRTTGPSAADRNFYHNQLRAAYGADDAATYAFTPAANGIFTGNATSGFDNGAKGTYNVDFPDVLTAMNGSVAAINYAGGVAGAAAVQYDGSLGGGKVVNWGFPFETITNSVVRDAYMSDVLRFFGLIGPPQLMQPQVNVVGGTVTLTWSASSGLKYRVQYKTSLSDANWTDLPPDVMASGTTATKNDSLVGQRLYRILLVN